MMTIKVCFDDKKSVVWLQKKCGMITKKACNQGDSSSFNQCEPQENLRLIPFRLV